MVWRNVSLFLAGTAVMHESLREVILKRKVYPTSYSSDPIILRDNLIKKE
jgi:hypothetical protein